MNFKKQVFPLLLGLVPTTLLAADTVTNTTTTDTPHTPGQTAKEIETAKDVNAPNPAADTRTTGWNVDRKTQLTPAEKGPPAGARSKQTLQIKQMLQQDRSLSASARGLNVTTVNGVTVLRGRVETVEESNRINSLAGQVVGPEGFRNELQIKSSR